MDKKFILFYSCFSILGSVILLGYIVSLIGYTSDGGSMMDLVHQSVVTSYSANDPMTFKDAFKIMILFLFTSIIPYLLLIHFIKIDKIFHARAVLFYLIATMFILGNYFSLILPVYMILILYRKKVVEEFKTAAVSTES